jgi:arylsulfatase A-like enzyme
VTNGNVAPDFGFARGFDTYELLPGTQVPGLSEIANDGEKASPPPRSHQLTARARRWLRQHDARRPFFLYLHAADPHAPYVPPRRFRERLGIPDADAQLGSLQNLTHLQAGILPSDERTGTRLLGVYDAEVAHNDHYFGRMLADLKRRGLYDDTLIVVIADHGEEFREHAGFEHGRTLYREVLHVPFVMKLPGNRRAGTRVSTPTQLVDVLPTLLARLGLPAPPGLEGADVLTASNGAVLGRRALFAHLALDGHVADSVQEGPWKMVLGANGAELFDRRVDPGDLRSVVGQHLVTAGYLRARIEKRLADAEAPHAAEYVTDEVLRNLRALGYVE